MLQSMNGWFVDIFIGQFTLPRSTHNDKPELGKGLRNSCFFLIIGQSDDASR